MAGLWHRYLPDVPWEDIPKPLQAHGVRGADIEGLSGWILNIAALVRLAHASLDNVPGCQAGSDSFLSTLSQTTNGPVRGRPKTARWAFWASFLIRENLRIDGKAPSYALLTDVIRILLSPRRVSKDEVRSGFVKLRRDAKKCAVEAAQDFLKTVLKADIDEKTFIQFCKKDLEKDLAPDSQMPPLIRNGKVNEDWLNAVINTRRAILKGVRKAGPLAGKDPLVGVEDRSMVGSGSFSRISHPSGTVHLGKATEVPIPGLPSEGCTVGLSFSRHFLDSEPYASRLYAVPAWWFMWERLFVAVPDMPRSQ